MAKISLNKPSEDEPLNKKLKTIKLNDQQKTVKSSIKNQSNEDKKLSKVDKSSKLKAKEQPKSDDLRIQRQLRRQKKKLDRLNKKKNQNKNQNKNKDTNQDKNQDKNQDNNQNTNQNKSQNKNQNKNKIDLNENDLKSKKNQHLSFEDKLQSIIKQENVNNKTIINHYKNHVAKMTGAQVYESMKQIKQLILDENLDKELRNYLINDLNRFINNLINQQNQTKSTEQSTDEKINDSLIAFIKFIALNALFSKSKKDDANMLKNIEEDTIVCFMNTFIKAITLIIRNSTNKKKKEIVRSRLDLLYQVMKYIYSLINNEKDQSNDYNQIFKKLSNSYKQIQLKDDDKQEQSIFSAFFLFYVYLAVNMFEEKENCMQILDEVNECFKRFTNKSNDDLHWADVFTDIILSLLSTASNLKRTVSDEVFSLISKEITKAGLEQLITALLSDDIEIDEDEIIEDIDDETSKEANEQSENDEQMTSDNEFEDAKEELSEQESNDEEIDENDLEVDENCSKEFVYESAEGKSENEEQSSSESDNNESDTESIDDEFRRKIKDALGNAAVSEDEDDEIVFDDEQMFKFDEAIAQVFKEKKKLKSKDQELTEFKSRCFDLVQILLNNKDIDLNFLIEIAKNTLQVLAKNNNSKSFDLIFKASATLKMYQTIENCKKQETNSDFNELLKTSVNLIPKLPEKVRNNLNHFVIWLLDLSDSNEIDLILNDLGNKLKKSSEVSLLIQLAERKKHLAESFIKHLIQIDLKSKLKNRQLLSYYRLITACSLNQAKIETNDLKTILNNSLDILKMKKNKGCRVLIEELVRFLTVFIKNHLEIIKKDSELVNRLVKLSKQSSKFRLSKKLRHKLNSTLKTIN